MSSTGGRLSVAVVVCAYTPRRLELTLAAVRGARSQADQPGDEVVLVVDHHDDLLAELAASVPDGVRVLPNAGERGLSAARNTGWLAARADVVAFLDDDAWLRPGAVAALRARMADPRVAVVAGAVHADWEGGRQPAWFPPEFFWTVGCDYRGLPPHGAAVRNPIGACMAVRRDALEAVGGFSTEVGRVGTLPVGCEETLLGIRVHQHLPEGLSVRDTAFAADHRVTLDRQDVRYFLRRCFHEGRSKALVARAVGAGDALSSERSYVLRTLSAAVAREAASTVRGDTTGAARAALVVLGLVTTAVGLLSVSAAPSRRGAPAPAAAGQPVQDDELVSVVVCTLGREPRLVRTVEAVLGQTRAPVDLVVVDNDPASGRTEALLRGFDPARVRRVPQPVKGLSAARNAGLAASRGRLVAFTDDDAVPDPTWLAELVQVLRSDQEGVVAAVTGRVLAAETSTREQRWFEEAGIFDKGAEQTTWSLVPRPADHLGVPGRRTPIFPYTAGEMGSGNNMLFRADALRALAEPRGVFDEALGAGTPTKGGEDLDVLRRVVLAGHVVVYAPRAVVRHYHRDTLRALRDQVHGHGTGMAALLVKTLSRGGRPAWRVLRSGPWGVHRLLWPTSAKNARKPAEMPVGLVAVELLGYLTGPARYVRSVGLVRRRAGGPS